MPLWDSVQRGLEKASQEAARMARVQKLRAAADGLGRQMNMQSSAIINKTMELFLAGQITHAELAPLCQDLENLRQQFEQIQIELRQLQAVQPPAQGPAQYPPALQPPSAPGGDAINAYPYAPYSDQSTEIAPPPPEFQPATGYSEVIPAPPPPPVVGVPPAAAYSPAAPITGAPRCQSCGALVQPQHLFCQSCGAPIQRTGQGYQQTTRGSNTGPGTTISGSDETMRSPQPEQPDQYRGGA